MTVRHGRSSRTERDPADLRDTIRRAFVEFLLVPSGIIGGFLLLVVGTHALDRATLPWFGWARQFMQAHVFAGAQATADLLGTIAGSLITMASITFSLLLLAVQQSAASMTGQVIDQFLRRRINQISFGFFVGLALFALITLATVDAPFNPVYGATLALLLTAVALVLLLLLLYTTIHQMRAGVIIEAIHDMTLAARQRQLPFLRRTRSASCCDGAVEIPGGRPHVRADVRSLAPG